jgi:hypothetical protein
VHQPVLRAFAPVGRSRKQKRRPALHGVETLERGAPHRQRLVDQHVGAQRETIE